MATLKEVAKLANVSLGSVSNVLNGKTQNEELIRRVEDAMRRLSYRPDATARSLKSTKSNVVGLILPDVIQRQYAQFLMELEERLREQGYSLQVKFSRNNRLIERKSVEAFFHMRVDGIVLYSMLRQKPQVQAEWRAAQVPMLLVSRYDAADFYGDNLVLDYRAAFRSVLEELRLKGFSGTGLVMEQDLLQGEGLEDIFLESGGRKERIKLVDSSRERGFQAFFELYTADPGLDSIIAGSTEIGEGVKKAIHTLKAEHISVYVCKESSWIEDAGSFAGELSVSQKKVAEEVSSRILEAIEKPHLHETITRYLTAAFEQYPAVQEGISGSGETLRFAMYDCSSARSLQMLAEVYQKESGSAIQFDFYSYSTLEQLLYQKGVEKSSQYDGFMMDITWLEGLVENGSVRNLDHLLQDPKAELEGFVEGAVKDCGMYVESLYAVPFMSGAQILFYQKDLFEDRSLQIRFERKYKQKLVPPKTWSQFQAVAEFFTRAYTPESPVEYGISMPRGENVYTTIDFLDRLWSYGGQVFNEMGEVSICSTNAVNALQSMLQSYRYSSGSMLTSWNEIAEEFAQGKSAMVILYNSDVGDINNYTKSRVAGNIGFSLVPGGTPVLGGWSLGLNAYGKHPKEAEKFLLWACGRQNGIPLALLGGSTLRMEYYERPDLENLEPWKYVVLQSCRQSRKRTMPEILDESRLKNHIYTQLIPEEIMRAVRGEISEQEAVEGMERRIRELVEK